MLQEFPDCVCFKTFPREDGWGLLASDIGRCDRPLYINHEYPGAGEYEHGQQQQPKIFAGGLRPLTPLYGTT